jgi:hypothetical protein
VLESSFTSAEGGFRVQLSPTKPIPPDARNGNQQQGQQVQFKWFILNQAQYEISYWDLENDLETSGNTQPVFDRLRDSAIARATAQLEVDKELSLSGHPGRELRFRDDGGLTIQRFYVAGKRLYLVAAFVPRKLDCALEHVVQTLDSFELIGEKSRA